MATVDEIKQLPQDCSATYQEAADRSGDTDEGLEAAVSREARWLQTHWDLMTN
jgi:hypothetical protein